MSFISLRTRKNTRTDKKLPPHSAWGHYRVRRGYDGVAHKARGQLGSELIRVKDVTLAYQGREVISSLSFCVPCGAYVSVIGENGTGKSTLLDAILGLKRVSSGKIELGELGYDEIGVVSQRNEVEKIFPASVYEVVLTGCLGRSSVGPFITRKSRRIAFANMEKLGITSLSSRQFGSLSGGQRQRVLLARALCAVSKLLVLDEAVTGVDGKTVADVYSLVESLNRECGMTVLSVTHDISAAIRYSSHILRLGPDGYFFGTVDEYLALPEAKEFVKENSAKEKDTSYGDGGFRYKGGDV